MGCKPEVWIQSSVNEEISPFCIYTQCNTHDGDEDDDDDDVNGGGGGGGDDDDDDDDDDYHDDQGDNVHDNDTDGKW